MARNLPSYASDDEFPAKRGRGFLALVALALTLPFLYEHGRVTAARWSRMNGRGYEVATPITDAVRDGYRSGRELAFRHVLPRTRFGDWTSKAAVPAFVGFTLVGVYFIKRAGNSVV